MRRLISPLRRSIGFVTGYEILSADVRLRFSDARRMVRLSGTEAPEHGGAGRPMHTISCELVLVAGRLRDLPGCAVSANP